MRIQNTVPFPQADDIEKVFAVADTIGRTRRKRGETRREALLRRSKMADRAFRYYASAAAFIGLVEPGENKDWALTDEGKAFLEADELGRSLMVSELLMASPLFRKVFAHYIAVGSTPATDLLRKWVSETKGLSRSTSIRRAHTVERWIDYVLAA